MPKYKSGGVLVASFADTHCGSTTGLMYPKEYQFADRDARPNKLQEALWQRFDEYTAAIAERRKNRTLAIVVNGDAVDGVHHDTHQIVTRKLSEQRQMFADVFDHFLTATGFNKRQGDRIYFVEGTTLNRTHGSPEDTDEIARDFGAVPFRPPPDDDEAGGWYPWQSLDLDVRGRLFRFAHHPPAGIGTRTWTKGNAIRGWLRSEQMEQLARGETIPRFVTWGHVHTKYHERVELDNGTGSGPVTEAIVLPCFQFPTEYVDQKMGWRASRTTIGGWWATVSADGSNVEHGFEYAELTHRKGAERV